jgi:murein DD-endopeptidase MepM/ murein hydrolase activator NlpD
MFTLLELVWFLGLSFSQPTTHQGHALVFPLARSGVSSPFGYRRDPITNARRHHSGIDLPAARGTPVRVIGEGIVVWADGVGAYGNLVVVRHSDGSSSHYGHLQDILTRPGNEVTAGEIIGSVGSTGRSTGPHLHLEIRRHGQPVDPREVLPALN